MHTIVGHIKILQIASRSDFKLREVNHEQMEDAAQSLADLGYLPVDRARLRLTRTCYCLSLAAGTEIRRKPRGQTGCRLRWLRWCGSECGRAARHRMCWLAAGSSPRASHGLKYLAHSRCRRRHLVVHLTN